MAENISWKELAEQKQKEWRNVLESRIEELEKLLEEKDQLLESEKSKFLETKEHFKYNLKLLEERDRELEKYDVLFSDMKNQVNVKSVEISELKIHIDDLKMVIHREEKLKEEMQSNYQRRLREKQIEVDTYKSSKDGELNEERQEYEKFRRNLQRQMTNVQNELDTQKRELTTEFENAMKKREHEFKVQTDELNAKMLEHELKVKLLEKELSLVRESNDKTLALAEDAEVEQRNLEKTIKQKEWELADLTAIKESQISELKCKLAASESSLKKLQEDFQRKYAEMDKTVREKEDTIERVKSGYFEREESLRCENQSLQSKLEDAQIRERKLSWTIQDITKEKELQIEKLHDELKEVKEKWDRHVSEISRDKVTHDLELSNALEEQRRLRLELDQRKEDLNRYKNELKLAAEREENLDRQKTQVELDWQRRTDNVEQQQYRKSEDLIERLSTAKTAAEALVKERERELQHKILLIKSLRREKDQLRAVLKKHDISYDSFMKYPQDEMLADDRYDIDDLQKQNEGLKGLVSQMRQEMESLIQGLPTNHVVMERLQDLKKRDENEVKLTELQKENAMLKERLEAAQTSSAFKLVAAPPEEKTAEVLQEVQGNVLLRNHILTLNEAIGSLRGEKVELAATVKKQQARIAYLENSLEQISKQPRLKQLELDQLNYEMNNLKRQNQSESAGMKNRISELELQLSEARREADEYHRASLERNQELVALGNQLSAMKMEMNDNNPSINFGAQELYIQQLQSELTQLRKRSAALQFHDTDAFEKKLEKATTAGSGNLSHFDYKTKLKSAAAKIVQLAKENQQLIESNNRLRAELKVQAKTNNKAEPDHFHSDVHLQAQQRNVDEIFPLKNESNSKGRLSELEKLQYELTRKELQFAQRFPSEGEEHLHGLSTDQTNASKDQQSISATNTVPSSFQPSHHPPFTNAISSSSNDAPVLMSMSSAGGDSIQKVWQMLDDSDLSGLISPSSMKERSSDNNNSTSKTKRTEKKQVDPFVVSGQKASSSSQSRNRNVRDAGKQYSKSIKIPAKVSKPKIRNYNIQDDNELR